MDALLGKITDITGPKDAAGASLEVRFKAACVLPRRTPVPEWLKDQVLTVRRDARDPREIGGPGDSVVLTPSESARWLYPLAVTPGVAYGELPPALQLRLLWWKDDKPPEYRVRANGRSHGGQWVPDGAGWVASVDTASLFPSPPRLPVTFDITCDRLGAACAVLPADDPCVQKLLLPGGERYRAQNAWYVVDISARTHGGGIASLSEKGRGVDHFRTSPDLIQNAFQNGGHIDRFRTGWSWSDKIKETAMTGAGTRREGAATRLLLEGVVDEGQNLRTSVAYTLYDDLPLILLQRDFHFGKAKDGDGKEKNDKPKERIDAMQAVGLGFRAAWEAERDGRFGSRLLCADGDRLVALRGAQVGDWSEHDHWRMTDGWAAAEHPGRREYTMYLFDPQTPPHLATWLGRHSITMEPFWPYLPVGPEDSVGYALALTAGEVAGAGAQGAWVACRTAIPGGGVRCALVARMPSAAAGAAATFALGDETREAPLERILVPGVGGILYGAAEFAGGRMDATFDATVAGIAGRRQP
jgi:hypothetical protein